MSEEDRISLARLEEKVSGWMESTEIYRISLCNKIAEMRQAQIKIMESLYSLPCKERGEMYRGLGVREKLMWGSIGITFGIMIKHLFGI